MVIAALVALLDRWQLRCLRRQHLRCRTLLRTRFRGPIQHRWIRVHVHSRLER
jgi:hypothetical protein